MSYWLHILVVLLTNVIAEFARRIDELTLGQLLVLTFVLWITALHVHQPGRSPLPSVMAAVFFLGYFLHRFAQDADDFSLLLEALIRGFFAYKLVWSIAAMALPLTDAVLGPFRRFRQVCYAASGRSQKRLTRLWKFWHRESPQQTSPPPPAPRPISRRERMQSQAAAAQADFETEVALLDTLSLDSDEREVMVLQAKQRLLQKLYELSRI